MEHGYLPLALRQTAHVYILVWMQLDPSVQDLKIWLDPFGLLNIWLGSWDFYPGSPRLLEKILNDNILLDDKVFIMFML